MRIHDISLYISGPQVSFSSSKGVTIGYSILTHFNFISKCHFWPGDVMLQYKCIFSV